MTIAGYGHKVHCSDSTLIGPRFYSINDNLARRTKSLPTQDGAERPVCKFHFLSGAPALWCAAQQAARRADIDWSSPDFHPAQPQAFS